MKGQFTEHSERVLGEAAKSPASLDLCFADGFSATGANRRRRAELSRQRLRVLLIEDNPGDVELVRERLSAAQECEVEVCCEQHLEPGLARLRSEAFDVVIADLSLPDATPAHTLARIRETRESVAVVVLSGSADEILRREALRAGAQEYLVKGEPATLVLARCLTAAVERHRGQSIQRQLERWISVTPDAVVVTSTDGVVKFFNHAALELFGRSEAELLQENLCFAVDDGLAVELDIFRKGERRIGEMRVVPIEWRGSHALLATIRDQTHRRNAEVKLASVDRLVTIGTLAASIVHEINNPMAAMMVNLELASMEAAAHPEHQELAQVISDAREAANRVRAIAGDLRMLSRSAEDRLEPVDIRSVVETTLRLAGHETRSRARVFVEIDDDTPIFKAHSSRLGQVLLNLVVNAAQAIGDGAYERSAITVTARPREPGWVELAVADTGPGMSEDVQRRLFTPFFTSKPASQGTGLGLSICQRIVESYGGRIEVESRVGIGTTFRVLLPISPASAPPSAALPAPPPLTRRGQVLLIYHDLLVGRAVARALKREHDVEIVRSGAAALAALRNGTAFDVVLSDATLPDMTGGTLYELVERELPAVAKKMVFLCGDTLSRQTGSLLHRLPNPKLEKPLNFGALSSLIAELVHAASS